MFLDIQIILSAILLPIVIRNKLKTISSAVLFFLPLFVSSFIRGQALPHLDWGTHRKSGGRVSLGLTVSATSAGSKQREHFVIRQERWS